METKGSKSDLQVGVAKAGDVHEYMLIIYIIRFDV